MKRFQTVLAKLNFKSSSMDMQEVLFDEILAISFIISILNLIDNIIIGFPFNANYKWFFVIFLSLVINKYKRVSKWVPFVYIAFIIVVILPLGWYHSGADNNNVITYVFLITVAVTFLFRNYMRITLLFLNMGTFTTFVIMEYLYPDLLPTLHVQVVLLDRLLQVSIGIFASFIMLRQFSNAYYRNTEQLLDLNEQLQGLAFSDPLTGIHNRAFIFNQYEEAIQSNASFCTVMIDIDDFKSINDTYGHLIGDEILSATGTLLKAHFSPIGHVARYGGDEFILLVMADLETTAFKLALFAEAFHNLSVVKKVQATLSAGYAPYLGSTINEHLTLVDQTLYQAKNTGKNRIVSAGIS